MAINCIERSQSSAEAIALSHESCKSVVRQEVSQQGFVINNVEVREGEDYSAKPAIW